MVTYYRMVPVQICYNGANLQTVNTVYQYAKHNNTATTFKEENKTKQLIQGPNNNNYYRNY